MKRIISITLLFVLLAVLLSGCIGCKEAWYSPKCDSEEIWVCEKPFFEFSWNEKVKFYTGKADVNGSTIDVCVNVGLAGEIAVFSDELLSTDYINNLNLEDHGKYLLFSGKATYEKDVFVLKIKEVFDESYEDYPRILRFWRYNKEEYIREYGELE